MNDYWYRTVTAAEHAELQARAAESRLARLARSDNTQVTDRPRTGLWSRLRRAAVAR